jgi:hypothetical protein
MASYGRSSESLGGTERAKTAERDVKGRFLNNNYCGHCRKRIKRGYIWCWDCLIEWSNKEGEIEIEEFGNELPDLV